MKLGDLRKKLRALALPGADALPVPRSLVVSEDGGEAPARCPRCHAVSPCVHFDSVDVGLGALMTGNHQYSCPVHGDFMFNHDDGKPIFAEDELARPVRVDATLTTPEEARDSAAIVEDIKRAIQNGVGGGTINAAIASLEGVPEVAWAGIVSPPKHFDSRCIIDPTTGTRLLPGKTTIAELRMLVPAEEPGRFPDITLLPEESLGVGTVFIVSPGGPVARIDIDPLGTPSPDEVKFAPVCAICEDPNCETPNAKH